VKERPILFSAPMVRALFDGTKTQTRRAVKPRDLAWMDEHQGLRELCNAERCPYGQPGDRLWVKETFAHWHAPELFGGRMIPTVAFRAGSQVRRPPPGPSVPLDQWPLGWSDDVKPAALKWTPSIHMPRRFSRITLEITDVRVQRLQEITEADAVAEGVAPNWCGPLGKGPNGTGTEGWLGDSWIHYGRSVDDEPAHSGRESFESLWNFINGAGAWAANPWIWALTFKQLEVEGCRG
jgi:hypothetical protein